MSKRCLWLAVAVTAWVGAIVPLPANAVLINFDGVADSTDISNAFAAQGVTFNNPIGGGIFARSTSLAASPGNVISVLETGVPAFDARLGAIEAVFSLPQAMVSIDAAILRVPEGLGAPTNFPKLEVFKTDGSFFSVVWDFVVGPQPAAGGMSAYQTLVFTSLIEDIAKVRFFSGQPNNNPSNFGLFDNLNFAGLQTPIPVPAPASLPLFALGFLALMLVRKRAQAH